LTNASFLGLARDEKSSVTKENLPASTASDRARHVIIVYDSIGMVALGRKMSAALVAG
jgi:hypothetical protein